MKRLFLIDGHGLAYRAFYAIANLSNSKGVPTNAVYGFTTMLLKLLKEEKPDYLLVTLDSPTPTFRHQIYPDYKAQRQKMPEEMRQQIPLIQEVVKAFNLPVLTKDGYEADDLLAAMAKQWRDEVDEVVIVTSDKDALQLVETKIKVLATKKGLSETILYDLAGVKERFGVQPEQVVDVLALAGDSSDNVPGVKGIGEKKAIDLVQRFGGIEQIYSQLDQIDSQATRKQLETDYEKALLSKRLVTLELQIPLQISLADCQVTSYNKEKLLPVLTELGFRKIINELNLLAEAERGEYKPITSQEELSQLIRRMEQAGMVSLSLQMTDESDKEAELAGIALACQPGQAYYIGMDAQVLSPILESERIRKYGYDLKSVIVALSRYGLKLRGIAFDVMVADYLLNPAGKHNLTDMAFDYLGIKAAIKAETADYACYQADISLCLIEPLTAQLRDKGLIQLFEKIEMPLIEVLASMEQDGIKVDIDYLQQLSQQFEQELTRLEQEIYTLAGTNFNINSPKQLSFILFEKMHLPVSKKTRTAYSTNEQVLNELRTYHPLPGKILEYRELAKLKSTYVDALSALVNPQTGRLHTSYNQTGTTTGRLSSREPNLQNIPIKTGLGRLVRQAFVPQTGYLLLCADYSQIELRLLAHISEDPNLIDSFLNDEDIHTSTASEIFGVKPDLVTQQMRRTAKVVNFGITYGMSPYGLSQELNISSKQAKEIIERYFNKYSRVKEYIERTINEVEEKGYITTMWGRRRYLPDINSSNKTLRELAQRQAINMPIQGSCADIIKLAMLDIHQRIDRQKAKMLLQVHDELVFEVLEEETEGIISLVRQGMEKAAHLRVPLKVDIKLNSSWEK